MLRKPLRTAAALAMLMLLPACGGAGRATDSYTIASTPSTAPVGGRATLDMAIPIPGADACIIPFAVESTKGWFDDRDPFTRGGRATSLVAESRSMASRLRALSQPSRWHNAILKRFTDGHTVQVLDRRGVISRYSFFGHYNPHDEFVADWIIFIATTDDTNADGLLNDRDASRAIIASADGSVLFPVTPADGQVWGITQGDVGTRFYFRVGHDTDGDHWFNEADTATIYTWTPASGTEPAQPAVDADAVGALERLLR